MKRWTVAFLMLGGLLALGGANAVTPLHFPMAGFTIAPLEADSQNSTHVVTSMYLPPVDGFSPNVNVLAQKYDGSLDDYIKLSKDQFTNNNWTIASADKLDDHTVRLEYSGPMQGRNLHFYTRIVTKPGWVYLATATAEDTQWDSVSGKLKACVDSLQLDAQ